MAPAVTHGYPLLFSLLRCSSSCGLIHLRGGIESQRSNGRNGGVNNPDPEPRPWLSRLRTPTSMSTLRMVLWAQPSFSTVRFVDHPAWHSRIDSVRCPRCATAAATAPL